MEGRPKDGWKLKRDSAHKLVVWFEDGNARTFYSLDWAHPMAKAKDESLGLSRLLALVEKHAEAAGTAIIYEVATGKVAHKFYKGQKMMPR